jgi:hypothetical protein
LDSTDVFGIAEGEFWNEVNRKYLASDEKQYADEPLSDIMVRI